MLWRVRVGEREGKGVREGGTLGREHALIGVRNKREGGRNEENKGFERG